MSHAEVPLARWACENPSPTFSGGEKRGICGDSESHMLLGQGELSVYKYIKYTPSPDLYIWKCRTTSLYSAHQAAEVF